MTVYVDNGRTQLGRMFMCHMLADTEAELHAMADCIGVHRVHFQGDHYDICQKMRTRALVVGARAISKREAVAVRRQFRRAA